MAELPGRMLKKGLLYVDRETSTVHTITDWDPVLPGTRVYVDLKDQMTGEVSDKGIDWEERVLVFEPFKLKIGGAGQLVTELAVLPDDDGRFTYRWRVLDSENRELGSEADIRSGTADVMDEERAMSALLSMLTAAAEAREGSDNTGMFSPEITEWARQNSDELQVAALELEERGIEL